MMAGARPCRARRGHDHVEVVPCGAGRERAGWGVLSERERAERESAERVWVRWCLRETKSVLSERLLYESVLYESVLYEAVC